MSKLSINNLPTELIIEIFKLVDDRSLKCATLVCKLWNELIESSCRWSIIIDPNPALIDFLMTTNKKFNKMRMECFLTYAVTSAIAILQRHGSSVVHLMFRCCKWNECEMMEMLRFLPNLEELILYDVDVSQICFSDNGRSNLASFEDIPNMTKLKALQFLHSDYDVLKCLRNSKVNTIKIRSHRFKRVPLVDFLRCQPHLTTLTLYFIEPYQLLDETMPFQLTHLSMYNFELAEPSRSYSNFLNFLETQTKTMKAFILVPRPAHSIPDFIYDCVLTKLENLKSLRLDLSDLPRSVEFYNQIQPNRNINNIICENPYRFPQNALLILAPWFNEFLSRIPNIAEITIHKYWDEDHFYNMSIILKEIKKLSIDLFDAEDFYFIKFPKLNCLNVKRFHTDDFIFWKQFIGDNSQITELTIHSVSESTKFNDFVQQTTEILKLHTLRIGKHISVDESFFDIIRKNCSELKILELPSCCIVQRELNGIPGLQFRYNKLKFGSNELDFRCDYRPGHEDDD